MEAEIIAIEYTFPKNKISNSDLQLEFEDYDFSKFEKKVGIINRYVTDENQTALDLAVDACNKLFLRIDKSNIDFVLYCTQSPEYFLPTTACILQNKLKLNNQCGALDFNLGCSGYTYGLGMAKSLINSGQASNILLVTAETYSKYLHPKDKSNRAIFGDAASATLISKSKEKGISDFLYGTDGSGYDKLIIKNGCARSPITGNSVEKSYGSNNIYSDDHLYMNGPEVFNFTNEVIPNFTEDIIIKNNIDKNQIDQFIFHQANAFMLNFLRKKMKIDKDKFYIDLADGGNTVSSTIPIALKRYSDGHKLTNENIVVVGFGVGLSWSGGLIKINEKL